MIVTAKIRSFVFNIMNIIVNYLKNMKIMNVFRKKMRNIKNYKFQNFLISKLFSVSKISILSHLFNSDNFLMFKFGFYVKNYFGKVLQPNVFVLWLSRTITRKTLKIDVFLKKAFFVIFEWLQNEFMDAFV